MLRFRTYKTVLHHSIFYRIIKKIFFITKNVVFIESQLYESIVTHNDSYT